MRKMSSHDRRGAVLPLFVLMLVGLVGFLALAIDIGIVAVAETQCQNAADNAALAGCRSLNGASNGNTSGASTTAQAAAAINPILSKAATASQVSIQHGAYHYDYSSQTFTPTFPPVSPDNYNLTQVTVTPGVSSFFSRIFGLTSLNVTASATAAYRPRDVTVVLDFSGSMNNETDLWNCESYLGSMINTPNNTDPVFPQWGVYSTAYSSGATIQCTSTDSRVGNCNITVPIGGIPALVNDFFANNRGAAAVSAFTASSATSTVPVGDTYLTTNKNATNTPGRTVAEISGSTSLSNTSNKNFVSQGYKSYTGKTFNGYTIGPNYWGKTFFIWPPDATNDWRKQFFLMPDGITPVNDDTALWDSNGNWLQPSGNYIINYKAILSWLSNTGANPFPAQLRSGNILYYTAIPTDVPAASYNHAVLNSTITNQDQRFWKEYIDFALGVWRDPTGTVQTPGSSTCSYGPDFACGDGTSVSITGPDSATKYNGTAFVAPTDNPLRPRHRFWFGPMTMIQYVLDTSISPGTFHDISMVPAKLGIAGAVTDIQQNHPNDMVAMIYYARPSYAGEPSTVGTFDNPISSLGRNYTSIVNSLWYPPNSGTSDVRPWDANGKLTPRAHGDFDSNTATSYGLMLAYNQLSGNVALQSSGMGGYGRKTAQRLVILETDGLANASTSAGITNAGAYQGYFNIGTTNTYSSSSTDPNTDAINVANQICALYNDTSNGLPGFSTTAKPVSIECIAFGAIYEPSTPAQYNSAGISLLQSISTIGGSTFPSSAGDATNGYKWCIGTLAQRQLLLQQAFTKILDSTVPISLVK
jgi:Flp pilus assembly protein TadG